MNLQQPWASNNDGGEMIPSCFAGCGNFCHASSSSQQQRDGIASNGLPIMGTNHHGAQSSQGQSHWAKRPRSNQLLGVTTTTTSGGGAEQSFTLEGSAIRRVNMQPSNYAGSARMGVNHTMMAKQSGGTWSSLQENGTIVNHNGTSNSYGNGGGSGETRKKHSEKGNDSTILISQTQEGDHAMTVETPVPPSAAVKSYDEAVTEALQSMSITEREEAYEDIHGVPAHIEETNEFLTERYSQFEEHLTKTDIRKKAAYAKAVQQNASYVYNPTFRLKFLRCERYDAKAAAERFIRHFESKLCFFDEALLTTDITMNHMSPKVRKVCTSNGSLQVLPVRDTSGRLVAFSFERYSKHLLPKDENIGLFLGQIFWYFMMQFSEDEESTKKGIVYIGYSLDNSSQMSDGERDLIWKLCLIVNSVPVKISSFHYCFNDPKLRPFISLVSMGLSRSIRSRFRVHHGTHQEVLYSLMTYGLPVSTFPVTGEGHLKKNHFHRWLNHQTQRESNMEKYKNAVFVPNRHDVIFGRGKSRQLHPGNRHFHDVLAYHYDAYDSAKRKEKPIIAMNIVQQMKKSNINFLVKDDNDMWVIATDAQAREKVCHGFRKKRENDKAGTIPFAGSNGNGSKDHRSDSVDAETTKSSPNEALPMIRSSDDATKKMKIQK